MLPGRYHHFRGNDRAGWRTDLRSYEKVIYRDVWPGVDLVFQIRDGALVYDSIARGGAESPGEMFQFEGVEGVVPQGDHELWIENPVGRIVQRRTASGAGSFLAPAILGGKGADLMSNVIANRFLETFDWPFGSALAIILLVSMLLFLMIVNKYVALEDIYGPSK